MSRITRIGTALAVLTVAAVTACSPGAKESDQPQAGGSTDFKDKTLTYVYFTDGPDLDATKDLIAKFEQQTGAHVNLQTLPYADLVSSLQARLSGGNAPDVARLADPAPFSDDLLDLATYLGTDYADQFIDGPKPAVLRDNRLIAVPSDLTMNGPFVNVDQFRRAHEPLPTVDKPWTWDQMVAAAKRVQAANHTEFALAIDKSGHRVSTILSQFGTTMIGTDGKEALDQAKAEKALGSFTDLLKQDAISRDFWLGSGTKYKGGNDIFLAQAAPVYLSGNWQVSQFATAAKFTWAAAPNPCEDRCGGFPGGKFMGAFKQSKNQALAAEFVRFMNDKDNQAAFCAKALFLPTRKDLVQQGVSYPNRQQDMAVFLSDIGKTPDDTYATTNNPAFSPSATALITEIAKIVADQESVADGVRSLKQQIEKAVRESGS